MQRGSNPNNPRNVRNRTYITSGVASQNTPGGKKPSNLPKVLRRVLVFAIVLVILLGLAYGLVNLFSQSDKPVRINARPTDNIQPFGENILYYDGTMLHCVGPNGNSRWQYALGNSGDYSCSKSMVVAWSGSQLVVLNKDGQLTYSDRMEQPVRFARIGDAYVAAVIGEDLSSTVRVTTHNGILLENINIPERYPDLYLLDVGFLSSRGQLIWVLGLDINSNAPISHLSTHEPGKMSTGAVELQDDLVYSIYTYNNNLMVVDTSKVRTFSYKCVEQTDSASILVYGWQVKQVRTIGRNTYALFEQMPQVGNTPSFSELRLITNDKMGSIRLLSPCFASGLSDKGVYGFGTDVIYYAPYGTASVRTTRLTYPVTDFVCMLDGGRAVMVSGTEVFIMKLPE